MHIRNDVILDLKIIIHKKIAAEFNFVAKAHCNIVVAKFILQRNLFLLKNSLQSNKFKNKIELFATEFCAIANSIAIEKNSMKIPLQMSFLPIFYALILCCATFTMECDFLVNSIAQLQWNMFHCNFLLQLRIFLVVFD